jgi:MoaA/NifB/PqqE/SkfB family radical SAM enzyme
MSELGPRPRGLPIAPTAAPSRKRLPLAETARPSDAVRPIYAVWEITLRCDLACRHCGSRAGRARPDELTTEEALDLVAQMAEMGVREITVIGGEAYLRDDWTRIVAAIVDAGMECGMTTGGRGIARERRPPRTPASAPSRSRSTVCPRPTTRSGR